MCKRTLAALILASAMLQAGSLEGLSRVDRSTAARLANAGGSLAASDDHTNVTMYAWTDKYVYQPGEQLTLRNTVKTNDPYPYTMVVYRQNNQTGKRTYFASNKSSEDAIDIYGRTFEEGFQPVRIADQTRAVAVGEGGWLIGSALA